MSSFDFDQVAGEFVAAVGEQFSRMNLIRFLCGIYTPLFTRLKIKQLPHFGVPASYPFAQVRKWVEHQCPHLPDNISET